MPGNDKSTFDLDDIMQEARGGASAQQATPTGGKNKFAQHPPNIHRREEAKAPLAQQVAQSKEYEKMGKTTGEIGVGAAMAGLPMAPGVVGAAAGLAGRGMMGMEGARYGGKLSSDLGIGPWPGRVAGGVAGTLAPEAVGKMSNPIMRGIAGLLGRSAPEVAATPEEASLATKVMRGGTSSAGPEATGAAASGGDPSVRMDIKQPSDPMAQAVQQRRASWMPTEIKPTTTSASPQGPSASIITGNKTPFGTGVEDSFKKAGLYTPYSSAQETGMWHAGQGAVPSPYEEELKTLLQKLKMGGGQ